MLDNSHGKMRSVVYKSRNVVLGHLRKLLLEDAFQTRQNDKAVARTIVVYNAKLDVTSAFF